MIGDEEEGIRMEDADGCPVHGDGRMRECRMCGIEFCAACSPGGVLCPDCEATQGEDEEELRSGGFADLEERDEEEEVPERIRRETPDGKGEATQTRRRRKR